MTQKSKEPAMLKDVEWIVNCIPGFYHKKVKEASLYTFGINSGKIYTWYKVLNINFFFFLKGQRCFTCHGIQVSDILAVVLLKNGRVAVKVFIL